MPRKPKSEVEDDVALDDKTEAQAEDSVDVNPDDTVEPTEPLDDDLGIEDPEDPGGSEEEEEINPELIALAVAQGMTEADAVANATAMGQRGFLSYLAARPRLRPDDKKEPEKDPFVLNLSPEEAADLSPALRQEMKRRAAASRDGIKAARDEVAPLKAEIGKLRKVAEAETEQRNLNSLQNWCNQQKDGDLGDSREADLTKKQEKFRFEMWKEVLKYRSNLKPDAFVAVDDVCEIALNKVFKGKRKQQARRNVTKAATEQSESAVGRASTVKRPPESKCTQKTSEESVRALFQKAGMV